MQPVRNPQRGEDKLREAQQEVKLRQGASFTWMKAARMGGLGTRVMAQRGLRPIGGPPFTLSDLAPWARGQIVAARHDDILRATANEVSSVRPSTGPTTGLGEPFSQFRQREPAWAYQGLQPNFTLAGRLTDVPRERARGKS